MSKRAKILAAILAIVVLSATGIIAGVMKPVGIAAAQEEPAPEEVTNCPRQGLLGRVAEILDIPEEDLANAFKQAQREMREEVFNRALDKAVERGRISPEQAGETREWWGQRPESLGLFPYGFRGFRSGYMWRIYQR